MYQDLHSHTYYSFCGGDNPEDVVKAAIKGGLQVIGITDHNYGIGYENIPTFKLQSDTVQTGYGRSLKKYFDHINLLREKYKDKITVLRGIEICTLNNYGYLLPDDEDVSYFDYCLIENLSDIDRSVLDNDLFTFVKRLKCKAGIAHTDMFSFLEQIGEDPLKYFRKMAKLGVFWEMNVSYDSTHHYREHSYVKEFFNNKKQQEIIKKSGVEISIGFDGHKVIDYLPERIKEFCEKLEELKIPFAFAKELKL